MKAGKCILRQRMAMYSAIGKVFFTASSHSSQHQIRLQKSDIRKYIT